MSSSRNSHSLASNRVTSQDKKKESKVIMNTRDKLITQPGVLSQAHPKSPKFATDVKHESSQNSKGWPVIDHSMHMTPSRLEHDLPYNPSVNFSFSRDI